MHRDISFILCILFFHHFSEISIISIIFLVRSTVCYITIYLHYSKLRRHLAENLRQLRKKKMTHLYTRFKSQKSVLMLEYPLRYRKIL